MTEPEWKTCLLLHPDIEKADGRYISEQSGLFGEKYAQGLAPSLEAQRIDITYAPTPQDADRALAGAHRFDALLCPVSFGGEEGKGQGVEYVQALREKGIKVPIVLLAENWGETVMALDKHFSDVSVVNTQHPEWAQSVHYSVEKAKTPAAAARAPAAGTML
jgi:hypothetical protein